MTWPFSSRCATACPARCVPLIAALDRIRESGLTGADAVQAYLEECLNLGDQLILPLCGAPASTDAAALGAIDVIVCGAMITQPLPNSSNGPTIARRHIRRIHLS